jgi:hypothetical protein
MQDEGNAREEIRAVLPQRSFDLSDRSIIAAGPGISSDKVQEEAP